ncbi:MAG: FAD-binding oxidoreductase [Patescibacteria group bacterium]|nr:FAD-binding oxidoreductase [Patescibacteria group bacterium]
MITNELREVLRGEVADDNETLTKYSRDASLFEVRPAAVVFPKDVEDVKNLVRFIKKRKKTSSNLSLTARSGGTDMSGGPLSESIVVDFVRHFNHIERIKDSSVVTEPGVFYRDFEKETLKEGLLLPTYPASREICTVGGMVANNAGGEKTLRYGKTEKYVKELKVVLSDGNEYALNSLNKKELKKKMAQSDFEGEIYRKMYNLLEDNYDVIQDAKPKVSKNSAGYALWNVWDRKCFDLTQLFVGSQGTLGIITEVKFQLIKTKEHRKMAILFLKDLKSLPEIINTILPLEPEGLEMFDDNTLKLAIRFFPAIAKKVKSQNLITFAWQFLPDALIQLRMFRLAKLVVLVQFAENSNEEAERKLQQLEDKLKPFKVHRRILHTEKEAEKYWVIRRESFNLLRQHVKGKRTAPFVDDIIVQPSKLPELLPKVQKILKDYNIKATLAGHAGSGNFHIIPLMDLTKESERKKIPEVADKIYDLVIKYGGSITAEHNDGIIRSPYLKKMYGNRVYGFFEEVKNIFDPENLFNPGKKVYADPNYSLEHISRS